MPTITTYYKPYQEILVDLQSAFITDQQQYLDLNALLTPQLNLGFDFVKDSLLPAMNDFASANGVHGLVDLYMSSLSVIDRVNPSLTGSYAHSLKGMILDDPLVSFEGASFFSDTGDMLAKSGMIFGNNVMAMNAQLPVNFGLAPGGSTKSFLFDADPKESGGQFSNKYGSIRHAQLMDAPAGDQSKDAVVREKCEKQISIAAIAISTAGGKVGGIIGGAMELNKKPICGWMVERAKELDGAVKSITSLFEVEEEELDVEDADPPNQPAPEEPPAPDEPEDDGGDGGGIESDNSTSVSWPADDGSGSAGSTTPKAGVPFDPLNAPAGKLDYQITVKENGVQTAHYTTENSAQITELPSAFGLNLAILQAQARVENWQQSSLKQMAKLIPGFTVPKVGPSLSISTVNGITKTLVIPNLQPPS